MPIELLAPLAACLAAGAFASALRTASSQSRQAEERDYLTGLLNRRAFFQALARAAREQSGPVTLVYVDLDGFRAINHGLGFEAGDALLRLTAETLSAALPPRSPLGRLEGDTFGLLLVGPDAGEVQRLLEGARSAFEQAMSHEHWNVTMGLGAVSFMPPPGSAEEADSAAAAQLAQAKRAGRGSARHCQSNGSAGLLAKDVAHAPHRVDQPG